MLLARTELPEPIANEPSTAVEPLSPRLLAAIALDYAATTTFPLGELPGPGERFFERVHLGQHFDIWLIRWGLESRTALHDHGGSAGAFVVVDGRLVEYMPNPAGRGRRLRRSLRALDSRPMAPAHIHTVVNEAPTPATSVHVYSPPLASMLHYEESPDTGAPLPGLREVVESGTLPPRDAIDR